MKVYSLRIWEDDVLVHEFLPYKNGDVIGFKDTKTGAVIENCLTGANPFKVGGLGVGGSGSVFKIAPQGGTISVDGEGSLSAWAPGAVEYVWKKDGVTLEGDTGGELALGWQRKPRVSTYSVTPVYDVYGVRTEGEPVTTSVTNAPCGMAIILR